MSISKTQWKIASDRIVIRPFGLLFILGGVLAAIFIALFIAFRQLGEQNIVGSAPFALSLLAILTLFFLGGFTYILFDRSTSTMKKMLLGFIPVRTVPFNKLQGVNIVTQSAGGFSFRIFTKADRYGKGITISSGYSKDTDPNAVAFSNEVIPLIHQYLDAVDPLPQEKVEQITDFMHFTNNEGVYTLKVKKAGALVFGLFFLGIGVHECTPDAWLVDLRPFGRLLMTVFPIILGIVFCAAAYTKTTFNTSTRMIVRKSPIYLGNQQHPFENFLNFQTIRKTYNGIYSGTEVHMMFQKPGDAKAKGMLMSTIKNTKKIERFIQEVNTIMQ